MNTPGLYVVFQTDSGPIQIPIHIEGWESDQWEAIQVLVDFLRSKDVEVEVINRKLVSEYQSDKVY